MSGTSDRTIPATPRRRRMAERAGMIPVAGPPAWGVTVIVALLLLPSWWTATVAAAAAGLRSALDLRAPPALGHLVAPVMPGVVLVLVSASAGLAVRMLVDGARFHPSRALPDVGRVSVLAGLRRILSPATVGSAIAGAAGMAVALAVAWRGMCGVVGGSPAVVAPLDTPPSEVVALVADTIPVTLRALLPAAIAAALVVTAQWVQRRHGAERRLRMTPEELRDELRDASGSPAVAWTRPGAQRPATAPVQAHSSAGAV